MSEKKKNKKGCILPIVVMIILVVLLLVLMNMFGFGGGFRNDGNISTQTTENSDIETQSPTETVTTEEEVITAETTTEETIYIRVNISGSTYTVNGVEETIDSIISLATADKAIVEIVDDNAVNDAVEGLVSALENNGISYTTP